MNKQLLPLLFCAVRMVALAWIVASSGCVMAQRLTSAVPVATKTGRTEAIHQASVDWLARWPTPERVATLTKLADQIVDRLAAGGTLYVAGDAGFCEEMDYRAGGFAGVVSWSNQRMSTNDVLILGLLDGVNQSARSFIPAWIGQNNGRFSKALTIYIASSRWPLVAKTAAIADRSRWPGGLHFLDTDAPPSSSMSGSAVGQMATIAVAYALEGEMIAAASRKGRTLGFYTSMFEPGSDAFNEATKGRAFIDKPQLKPIPGGQLAHAYFETCHRQVSAFLASDQPRQVRLAGQRIAACQKRGGTIMTIAMGHVHKHGATIPPVLSRLALYGSGWQWTPPQGLVAGDTLFYLGYLEYPQKEVDLALGAGADVVTLSLPGAPDTERVTNIRCFWQPWDGCVEVPGYPYKSLPSSGVVQTPVWYSLMDEAAALVVE